MRDANFFPVPGDPHMADAEFKWQICVFRVPFPTIKDSTLECQNFSLYEQHKPAELEQLWQTCIEESILLYLAHLEVEFLTSAPTLVVLRSVVTLYDHYETTTQFKNP